MVHGMRCDALRVSRLARVCWLALWLSRGWCGDVGDGHGSAQGADLGGVDRHDHRGALARASRRRIAPGCASSWRSSRELALRSQWRRRPAGGSWSTSSSGSPRRCTWRAGRDQRVEGQEQRANADWADARHLRELLLIGRLPESWIPPAQILELRVRGRRRHRPPLTHLRVQSELRMLTWMRCCALGPSAQRRWPAGIDDRATRDAGTASVGLEHFRMRRT